MTHPTVPPKVTVILPTYNRAAYLTQAIDSIRAQTLKDWELIIIDDASTDTTPEVAQAFTQQDSRIHYHRHNTNQGVAIARNTGIKRARGTYIAFQDDDDLSHPERLQRQVEDLKTRPRYAFSQTWLVTFNIDTPYSWHTQMKKNLITAPFQATFMVPRHILHHVPYRPFFISAEDYDFHLRLRAYCRRHNNEREKRSFEFMLPYPLYAMRHASQPSRVNSHPLRNIYAFLADVSALHRQYDLPDPIDNAQSLDDAIQAIHPQFPRVLDQEPSLAQSIADCLLAFALRATLDNNTDAQANYRTLVERYFPQKNLTFHSSINGLDENLTLLKYHLHHAIRYNQPDSYYNGLYALIRFFPKHTPYTIAHKILFACLRRGRYAFILPYLRVLVKKTP